MLKTVLKAGRVAAGHRRRAGVATAVTLVMLAVAPAAFATGWSLQTVPTPPSTTSNSLSGVSCSSTTNCFAVGDAKSGGQFRFLVEHYNGASWAVQGFAGPPGQSFLQGVSCPSSSFCMAVGNYSPTGGGQVPLVFTYNGSTWTQQIVPLVSGSAGLSGVSCTSSTFCMAVGQFTSAGLIAAWSWNGSTFTLQHTGGGFFPASLTSVSCTSSTFCAAVGYSGVQFTSGIVDPFAEFFNGSTWNGPAVPIPGNSRNSLLTGVSCPSSSNCQAVGFFSSTNGSHTFGESYNGSGWSEQSAPPTLTTAVFGGQGADSCATGSFCWSVGEYDIGGPVNPQVLGDFWNGSSWQFAVLPSPAGTNPGLESVSCPTASDCEAVGNTSTNGQPAPFAEQYTGSVQSLCCIKFTPHHFALSVSRLEKHGATITAALKKPKTLVLLVQTVKHGRTIIVGIVPLGNHPAGTSQIHWSLRVSGKLLGKGKYDISLRSVVGDILSPPTPPGEIALAVEANGHVSVG
jgi:hypothetical protein